MKAHKIIFYICLIISIILLVGGFLIPPTGVIDGSVLSGSGILFGFSTLAQVSNLIRTTDKNIKMKKGDKEIEIK